jgi:hypothetical protein
MSDSDLTHRTIDPFSREVLEFPAVLELLHHYLSGPISEPLLERVAPHTNIEVIRRDLELAGEAREYLREGTRPGLAGVCEPGPLLEKLRVEGLALAALEILALVEVARAGLDMYRLFAKPSAPRAAQLEGTGGRAETGRTPFGPTAPRPEGGGRAPLGPTVPPAAPSGTPRLSELARALPDFRSLITDLGGKINPDGTVDSSASTEL